MPIIRHKKGQHTSSPLNLCLDFNAKKTESTWTFTESCKYNHNNADQGDWNKLTGIAFNLLNARANSIMCGWRYNVDTNLFELCAYYHVNSSFNPPAQALISVEVNEPFIIEFSFDKNQKTATMKVTYKGLTVSDTKPFEKFGINRPINTWFGGNLPTPHDMFFLKNI